MRISITTVREIKKEDLDDWIQATCSAMWHNYILEARRFPDMPSSAKPPLPADFDELKNTGRMEWTTVMGHTKVTTFYEVIE